MKSVVAVTLSPTYSRLLPLRRAVSLPVPLLPSLWAVWSLCPLLVTVLRGVLALLLQWVVCPPPLLVCAAVSVGLYLVFPLIGSDSSPHVCLRVS